MKKRFFTPRAETSLGDVCKMFELPCPKGAEDRLVFDISTLKDGTQKDISFLHKKKYASSCKASKAGFILTSEAFAQYLPKESIGLICDNPHFLFAKIAHYFYPNTKDILFEQARALPPIHPSAKLGKNLELGHNVVIGANVVIGNGTRIGSGSFIGRNVSIGNNCIIAPQCTIICSHLGNDVSIDIGARIGQDGFGFIPNRKIFKIPQIGSVVIGNDVDIGANSCIDRGTIDATKIGAGTKIDNLVQIAHNVEIGENCIIAGKVGIAGSTVLEDNVMIGGVAGINGHIRIGKNTQIAGLSMVTKSVPPHSQISGYPARDHKQWLKECAILARTAKSKDKQS